ncbi:MAG: Hemerythrin domain protein [uncultured Friedmanniella sp.]|uniref:Hemerythrin domain protein n=1 Tax=uncultured Friedmanniella sp. TaxID=335381 RepID=A0A6J4JXH3_9ACTN|nr:MAG: Hemerythrin domain protein [uncultured Friedmanniella sp.]
MTAEPLLRRSLADQDDAGLGGRLSVLVRQKADHVRLDALLHELADTPPAGQDPVLRRIYRLVFPHAFAEESVLWPVLRRILPDGPALTLEIEQEHQEVNELVTRLEQLAPDAPERPVVLERLTAVLREDVRDEEDRLLPELQDRVSTGRLRALGLAWELVRRAAPTRAHPVVARRPPGNAVAALPLTVVDRTRDLVDAALQAGPARGGAALTRVSRVLTRVSHAVEALPLLRRGEDPSTARG